MSLQSYIKEQQNMEEYVCYFSGVASVNNPRALFGSAFTNEYIAKLQLNCTKTNEYPDKVPNNTFGSSDLRYDPGAGQKLVDIDMKEVNSKYHNVSVSKGEINKNVAIGIITKYNNALCLIIVNLKDIPANSKSLIKDRFYTISEKTIIDYAWYNEPLKPAYATLYEKLMSAYNNVSAIDKIEYGADQTVFRNAAEEFLNQFADAYKAICGKIPVIKFVLNNLEIF